MSQQERISWVALVVTVLISLWYFTLVFTSPGDSHLLGPGMWVFAILLAITAIFTAVASNLLLRWLQKRGGGDPSRREPPDERDRLINLRASRNAYVVLAVGISGVLGLIFAVQLLRAIPMPATARLRDTVLLRMIIGPLTAPILAQWLLLALTLADGCRHATRIVSYRRGY